jgi:hypothetical protein
METAFVDHAGVNFSVHSPITITLDMNVHTHQKYIQAPCSHSDKTAWHKVDSIYQTMYKEKLESLLCNIEIYDGCKCVNGNCADQNHMKDIDIYCTQLIDACLNASDELPKVKKKKRLPFWNTNIKPLKEDALLWRKFWLECGKPSDGIIYENMKKSKMTYHYAVRALKRKSENLRKTKMADSLLNNKSRDFWTEVKKLKGNPIQVSNCVENKEDPCEIATHFADKYYDLYNSVPSDPLRMQRVKMSVTERITKDQCLEEMKISINEVKKALKYLKSNKGDGENKLFSNHLLYAPDILLSHISHLFSGMIMHGYAPDCLLKSTIISIPKNVRGDLSSDENYRGISLCSSIFKLYEIVLLQKQEHNLLTSDMQFAYKAGHSTTLSTLILKDTVTHILNRNSNVYCCFIDASKAFDRLRHDLLFDLLLQRNVNPLMIKSLIYIYEAQLIQTSWMGTTSYSFSCKNGVRQGGILSPILYAIYNDVLLQRLKSQGTGCWIGNHYYGALSYADDLCILSPTLSGLCDMLNTCEKYGVEYDVLYNPKKTQCMQFSRKDASLNMNINVKLCGKTLTWVTCFKYLGNWLTSNMSEESEITKKLGQFYGNVNNLNTTFKHVGFKSINKLFNSYCCHFYGSQAWNLNDKNITRVYTAWNKAVRYLCNVPSTTHTKLLPHIVNTLYVKEQIYLRTANLLKNMLNSKNSNIYFMAKSKLYVHTSIIGSNWHEISRNLGVDILNDDIRLILIRRMKEEFSEDNHVIYELLEILDGTKTLPQFSSDDVHEMLYVMCTS